ncbi:hypothetical protein F8388_015709 [Cannabis sativa]|uniref:Uncharacterized protein n=1 Tax=Cannabis sativa TaxID=3483 RepID=A0A7J6HHN9_CANSA|nr:hypothetical protein F8388_015709 [Cannabis sativa]KAF4403038.1 hypothetical protein G4B88_010490 [Cannabis sativa]
MNMSQWRKFEVPKALIVVIVCHRLSDEHVADLFMDHTRKLIEKHISSALTLLKSKTRATYTLYFTHNCLYINVCVIKHDR